MENGGGGAAADGGGAAGAAQTGITMITPHGFERILKYDKRWSELGGKEEAELLESIVKRVRDVADALKVRASNAAMFTRINRTPSRRRLQPPACLTPTQPVSFSTPCPPPPPPPPRPIRQ